MAQPPELVRGEDLPVGVNLYWRLQALIRSGRLPANERLPGVREFAAGAGVNVNTARAVYRRLEEAGLVVSQQGLGTFVTPHAPIAPALEEFAAQVTADAAALGIEPRELARALYVGTSPDDPLAEPIEEQPGGTTQTESDRRSARVALRGQIARLEGLLAAYPEAGKEGKPQVSAIPRVAGIDELERVRDDLLGRLKRAQAQAQERSERHDAARRWQEEALADPSSHRWEAVSREDLGEPGCGRVWVVPRWGPVGALMDWWRVKISSGCP